MVFALGEFVHGGTERFGYGLVLLGSRDHTDDMVIRREQGLADQGVGSDGTARHDDVVRGLRGVEGGDRRPQRLTDGSRALASFGDHPLPGCGYRRG